MKLKSKIIVEQSFEQVANFFDDVSNLAKWDRSVSKVIITPDANKIGSTFYTLSPKGIKTSYRVTEYGRCKTYRAKALLVDSRIFKYCLWDNIIEPVAKGTQIQINVELKLRLLFFFLAPILYFNGRALARDLSYLKNTLNKEYPAKVL